MSFNNFIFRSGQNLTDAYPQMKLQNIGYQTNNQYTNFPAKMTDGRSVVSSWQPGAVVNEVLIKQNNIRSNWEYRKYLMNNSETIRDTLFKDALNDVGYSVRHETPDMNNNHSTPKFYTSFNEPISHRHAEKSDLKDIYINREQLESRRVVPSLTQDEMLRMREKQ